MNTPEKLGLWDRFFNRYRKEMIEEGDDSFSHYVYGIKLQNSSFTKHYVKYKIIDRLTGSETIKKEYI